MTPKTARVLVIGGGIAGVSLGYELSADHDVVVLEAESALATHSTGRSAALFINDYGPPPVQSLTRASEPAFERFERDLLTPRLLTPRGVLYTAWDDDTTRHLKGLLDKPGSHVREVTKDEAKRICPALLSDEMQLAAFDPTVSDIDVIALHDGYVRGLRGHGGRVFTDARVIRAHHRAEGWAITTADGRTWHADVVVNAAGAWGDDVARICGVAPHGLTPCRRTVVIARPGQTVDPRWPVVADATEAWYFKPEGEMLLLSPGDETPDSAADVRADPLDVALALERVNAATSLRLRSVQTTWAGLRTFTADRRPIAGPHPDDPTLFCFLGQGGFGIQMAPALAAAAAELLRGHPVGGPDWSGDDFAPARPQPSMGNS